VALPVLYMAPNCCLTNLTALILSMTQQSCSVPPSAVSCLACLPVIPGSLLVIPLRLGFEVGGMVYTSASRKFVYHMKKHRTSKRSITTKIWMALSRVMFWAERLANSQYTAVNCATDIGH